MLNEIKIFWDKLPKTLVLMIIINCFYGLVILYSAGNNNFEPWAYKQMINICIFVPVMLFIGYFDIRNIYKFPYFFYALILLLLISVELFGYVAMGAKRWLNIGGFRIQPSEPTKIAVVLFLAKYFHDISGDKVNKLVYLLPAIIGVLFPVALIIKQPDLGTGMVVLIVAILIFFAARVPMSKFIISFVMVFAMLPVIWHNLHEYQKKRVEVFLNPDLDPYGSGYNIIQSKIAIGSGGLLGKGLGMGSQSHLSFLPEHQTDFIFACLAEDLGFLGGFILIFIYSAIIYLSLSISLNAKSTFGKLLVVGVISIFFSHAFINIGMVTGLLPVVGIPLPLVSYGGTMMASILIGFGFVINVHVHQRVKV